MSRTQTPRVLIVTGGLVSGTERSVLQVARKWWAQWRCADAAWLDTKIKLTSAEPVIAWRSEVRRLGRLSGKLAPGASAVLSDRTNAETASLTEVTLMTLLHRAGMPFETIELSALFSKPRRLAEALDSTTCVLLSTTYLHDLSEVAPVLARLKRSHNHIVVGGALTSILRDEWSSLPEVDVVAVGYGEMLVEPLISWINSGFTSLAPPEGGRLRRVARTMFLYSGTPKTESLDYLPAPDWTLASPGRNGAARMVYYESVRGCPYRCAFCNYPFLFNDNKFRLKSARRIASDWEHYACDLGVEYVTCLDSLFTVPRARLQDLCRLLIDRDRPVKWICYARADDLSDERAVALIKEAGAHQVHIGIESGDPRILDNMNKACSVESNARALQNCRRYGLTTAVSVIVGFPGETRESLEKTYDFLEENPPDFYFLATFSTRAAGVPILEPQARDRFGLRVSNNARNMAPYWEHTTMSCCEVCNHVRELDSRLMKNKIALNATLFYPGMLSYEPDHRETLLDLQRRAATRHPAQKSLFDIAHAFVDRRLEASVRATLGTAARARG